MDYFKTTGALFSGGTSYDKGHVFSSEEIEALGIDKSSLVPADVEEHKAQVEKTAPVADADAELDTAEGDPLQGAPTDAASPEVSGNADANGAGADKTLPHVVTQEDLDLNPELVADGVKVGDEVAIPAVEHTLTEEDRTTHPEYFVRPEGQAEAQVGDVILIPEDAKEEEPAA